jgi:hypothetical protein
MSWEFINYDSEVQLRFQIFEILHIASPTPRRVEELLSFVIVNYRVAQMGKQCPPNDEQGMLRILLVSAEAPIAGQVRLDTNAGKCVESDLLHMISVPAMRILIVRVLPWM